MAGGDRELNKLVNRINEISTLPHVVAQIIAVTSDATTDAHDLGEAIETDPALTERLLRDVNSAAHGLGNRVESLQQAVSMLGFAQVRNLALIKRIDTA